jgi:AraC family transcriptional regulator, transcriptional activator of pobA
MGIEAYCETTDMEKKKLFEIQAVGSLHENPCPRRNDTFKIIWFTGGNGNLLIDVVSHSVQENVIYLLRPGQHYGWKLDSGMRGYIMSFTFDFINCSEWEGGRILSTECFDVIFRRQLLSVDENTKLEMVRLAENMIKEYVNVYDRQNEILYGLLKLFIIYLTRQVNYNTKSQQATACVRLTRKFFQLLENNYMTRKQVVDYAQDLAITPNYLNTILKRSSGESASHHIQQRIILEAKRKAAYVDMNMKEIAYHLGFYDLSHFSRFFKNAAGLTFSEFKKESISKTSFA